MIFKAINDFHEVMRKLYEGEEVYVIFKLSKESTFEEAFGADGFISELEEEELQFVDVPQVTETVSQEEKNNDSVSSEEEPKKWSKWEEVKDEIVQTGSEETTDKPLEEIKGKRQIDWKLVDVMRNKGTSYKSIAQYFGYSDARTIAGGHANWKKRQEQTYKGGTSDV